MPGSTTKRRVLLLGDARQVHLQRWGVYLTDNGFDVLTASLEPVDRIAGARRRIHIPSLLPSAIRYPTAVPTVRRIIDKFRPDLVNAHFLPNYGVIAMMSGFSPWVLSAWGSDIMVLPEKSAFHRFRTIRVLRNASYITSDAEVMTERLVTLGASRDKIVTFPYGVDRDVFYPAHEASNSPGPRIVSNRKLEEIYNIETVISAFPSVLKQEPGATLTVAGSGARASDLRATAARTAPPRSVRFVGEVEHDRMPEVLRSHDLYVSMSLSDTTSVSLLEAMACGLFPIVSDIPANREWITNGQNGCLVDRRDVDGLANAIVATWRNPSLRLAAANRNAVLVETRADWHQNMGVLRNLIDRILQPAPSTNRT